MHLATPQSAILSAVIFNALIIVVLIPLALRGVRYRPLGAAALLRRNLLIYGLGGIVAPFLGIKFIDVICARAASGLGDNMKEQIKIAIRFTLVTTILFGVGYPLAVTGLAQLIFPRQANGSLLDGEKPAGSRLIGQPFTGDSYFHPRPSAAGAGYDP